MTIRWQNPAAAGFLLSVGGVPKAPYAQGSGRLNAGEIPARKDLYGFFSRLYVEEAVGKTENAFCGFHRYGHGEATR